MGLRDFFGKQFIDVIHWAEPDQGTLAWRFPVQDMEIQNGAQLTVRESQMAAFVNEGRIADILGPGLYTLNTNTLPVLTSLMNWDKLFQSPFKSDVYFFSTRIQTSQRWGTAQPVTIRDKDFGAVRLRAFGIYSWHLTDVRTFHTKISGTRDVFRAEEIEGQLRHVIIGRIADTFAESKVPFLDMAANQMELGETIAAHLRPAFLELGIALDSFVVESLSLPEELQHKLDQRISMNIVGDLRQYAQFQAAEALPIAAANEGGLAGAGAGLGAGMAMAQQMMNAMRPESSGGPSPISPVPPAAPAPAGDTKFCSECGQKIPRNAKFCPECGKPQA